MSDFQGFTPDTEGIDHINIYSKSGTKLGRFLSNFTLAPFSLHGIGRVMTMEGFWYYLQLGEQFPELLLIENGYQAKKKGRELIKEHGRTPKDDWKLYLYLGALQKIKTYPIYQSMLKNMYKDDLILTHYYYYGNAKSGYNVIEKSDDIMIKIWYKILDVLLVFNEEVK